MRADAVMMTEKSDEFQAVKRLVIDIETASCDAAALELERSLVKPAGNIKDPEKKAKNVEEKQNGIEEKNGLLDSNPIGCIGVEVDGALFHFSTFEFNPSEYARFSRAGIKIVTGADETELLKKFRRFCESNCDESTQIITFNGEAFDIPRLRHAFARNAVNMPEIIKPYARNWHVDLMLEYGRKFTVNNSLKKYVSMETVCKLFRIPFEKEMSGADVPQAIANREFYRVTRYNLKDVKTTSMLADVMGF